MGCPARCHTVRRCSGISRYVRDPIWRCEQHGGRMRPPRLVGEAVEIAPPCAGCNAALRKNSEGNLICITCESCSKNFHKTCTKTSREVQEKITTGVDSWTCKKCEMILVAICSQSDPIPSIQEAVKDKSNKMKVTKKSSLRILQWNADSLATKIGELRTSAAKLDLDVILIQETKLTGKARTPRIDGFKEAMRQDRVGLGGGGLLCYIKETLPFEKLYGRAKKATESTSFRVRLDKKNWVHISNVYVPPANSIGQEIQFTPDAIPTFESSIICGDFNGHTSLWDPNQPTDSRGDQILDWMIDNSLESLNDGSATRSSRITANPSSPDISLIGSKWSGKCTWTVEEDIGGSDHLPILITLNIGTQHQSIRGKKPRWKTNGVDWEKFAEAVNADIDKIFEGSSTTEKITLFNKTLNDAAVTHVGRVKPGRKSKPWVTPPVRAAIKQRNALRRQIKTKRKEWLIACEEAREAERKAKEESWKDVLQNVVNDADERKMWTFIKSLNGTPDNNSPNEVMVHEGKTITSSSKKADIIANHYARVSSHTFTEEERDLNRKCKRLLKSPTVNSHSCTKFTLRELKRAISKMRARGAPGPDDLPPQFFKALTANALIALLHIFNESWESNFCPQIWRNAVIIPLLKAGKPPSEIASFRPVSLTSVAVKILERMIANRLYHLAEENGWFSHLQAGFRQNRSCEDQVIRLTQAIEDGFQKKDMERSVLVLLDFSKAYDMVWQEKLLVGMAEKGVPIQFLRWLRAFLTNRQANVRFCDATSKTTRMRQGLPQGSVLSPILFLFYINECADRLSKMVDKEGKPAATVSLFADDVSIVGTHRVREEAQKKVQEAVDVVVEWSKEAKLVLNAGKSEASFFSTWSGESKWRPDIRIGGKKVPFKEEPRLLGVILDRTLSFGPQVKKVTEECAGSLKMLASLAHTEYGWSKSDLLMIFNTFFLSKLNYSSPAWQCRLSESQMNLLERAQNKALRIVTGQLRSSPAEALLAETGCLSVKTSAERACLLSVEKALRLPLDHPRRLAWENATPKRTLTPSWHSVGVELMKKLPTNADSRAPVPWPTVAPWSADHSFEVHPTLPGIKGRGDDIAVKRAASLARINDLNADIVIYTDGSADAGCRRGGSAAVITTGSAEEPVKMEVIRTKGAPHTSSCEEEYQALMDAANWSSDQDPMRILICTDSQSNCQALRGCGEEVAPLQDILSRCRSEMVVQWIPGHSEIPGNDMADEEANAAAREESEEGRRISWKAAKTMVKAAIPKEKIEHRRIKMTYACMSSSREKEITNKGDQVSLARLRTGHHLQLGATKHRYNEREDPSCPRCKEWNIAGEMQQPFCLDTLEHWLECEPLAAARMRDFGEMSVGLEILTKEPKASAAHARRTLRGAQLA